MSKRRNKKKAHFAASPPLMGAPQARGVFVDPQSSARQVAVAQQTNYERFVRSLPGRVDGGLIQRAIMGRGTARMEAPPFAPGSLDARVAEKAWRQIPSGQAIRSGKAWLWDPISLQWAMGFRDRYSSVTFDAIKRLIAHVALIPAIFATRITQVTAFAQPYRWTRNLGFAVRHKDSSRKMTPAEVAFCEELEMFILRCGRAEQNPWRTEPRDDFDTFLRKFVYDSLAFDSAAAELIYDDNGVPFEFQAVDGSTIRIAAPKFSPSPLSLDMEPREGWNPDPAYGYNGMGNAAWATAPTYVQVVQGQPRQSFTHDELIYAVRNPRTDLYANGYGRSEIEAGISVVTWMLYAEVYNGSAFSSGSLPKGLLNLMGTDWGDDELAEWQREWSAGVSGADNAWHSPVLQAEGGVQWIPLNASNREMEFSRWLEYLLKVLCALYQIDPSELNFDLHGGVQQTPLFEGNSEWKLKASRDRGLKPLLKFIAKNVNRVIDKIDDHFAMEFVGLDELSEQEKHELMVQKISSYSTLNEGRRELGMDPLGPEGDMPMNGLYFQAKQVLAQEKMQEQQAQAQAQGHPEQQRDASEAGRGGAEQREGEQSSGGEPQAELQGDAGEASENEPGSETQDTLETGSTPEEDREQEDEGWTD